jgi:hypothetical protein
MRSATCTEGLKFLRPEMPSVQGPSRTTAIEVGLDDVERGETAEREERIATRRGRGAVEAAEEEEEEEEEEGVVRGRSGGRRRSQERFARVGSVGDD